MKPGLDTANATALDCRAHSLPQAGDIQWDECFLSFHETELFVTTTSYSLVREPLYPRSIRRWRKYERHLAPLIAALGKNAGR